MLSAGQYRSDHQKKVITNYDYNKVSENIV